MNYVARIRRELAARLAAMSQPVTDDLLIELYTLLAIDRGALVDLIAVHNAWAVWRNRTRPEYRSLVPFEELSPEVQALDQPYVDAIREAVKASKWAAHT